MCKQRNIVTLSATRYGHYKPRSMKKIALATGSRRQIPSWLSVSTVSSRSNAMPIQFGLEYFWWLELHSGQCG